MKKSLHRLLALVLITSVLLDPGWAAGAAGKSAAGAFRVPLDTQALALSDVWMTRPQMPYSHAAFRLRVTAKSLLESLSRLSSGFSWIPGAFMAELNADPDEALRNVPVLFEQAKYRDVVNTCNAIGARRLADHGDRLISLVPLWVFAMQQNNIPRDEIQTALKPFIQWLDQKSEAERAALESFFSTLPAPQRVLSQFGLGIAYVAQTVRKIDQEDFRGAVSAAQKGVALLPDDSELQVFPIGANLIPLRHDVEGHAYWNARRAQLYLWKANYDLHELKIVIDFARKGMLAYGRGSINRHDINEQRWLTMLNVAINNMGLCQLQKGPHQEVLEEAGRMLSEIKALNADRNWILGLTAIIHTFNGEYEQAVAVFQPAMKEMASRREIPDDAIYSFYMRAQLALGNYQEANELFSKIDVKMPREIYENGQSYFKLGLSQKPGSPERLENYRKALVGWQKINDPIKRRIVNYLGETSSYFEGMLRTALVLGRMDAAVSAAKALLEQEGETVSTILARVQTLCGNGEKIPAKEEPFLMAFAKVLPDSQRGPVNERLQVLQAAKARGQFKSPEEMIRDWDSIAKISDAKAARKKGIGLFESEDWKNQPIAWRLNQLTQWALAWGDEGQNKKSPLAHSPQILQRFVKEIPALLTEQAAKEDEENLSPLPLAAITALKVAMEPWGAHGTVLYTKIFKFGNAVAELPGDVQDTLRAVEAAQVRSPLAPRYRALRARVEAGEDSPALWADISSVIAETPQPAQAALGKAFTQLSEALSKKTEALKPPAASVRPEPTEKQAPPAAATDEPSDLMAKLGRDLEKAGVTAKPRNGNGWIIGHTERVVVSQKPGQILLSENVILPHKTLFQVSFEKGMIYLRNPKGGLPLLSIPGTLQSFDVLENGKIVVELDSDTAAEEFTKWLNKNRIDSTFIFKKTEVEEPQRNMIEVSVILEPAVAELVYRLFAWGPAPHEDVQIPLPLDAEMAFVQAAWEAFQLPAEIFPGYQFLRILENGELLELKLEDALLPGDQLRIKKRPSPRRPAPLMAMLDTHLPELFNLTLNPALPAGVALAEAMEGLFADTQQKDKGVSGANYDHAMYAARLDHAIQLLQTHPRAKHLQRRGQWKPLSRADVMIVEGPAPDQRPWHAGIYVDPRTDKVVIPEAFFVWLERYTQHPTILKQNWETFTDYLVDVLGHENMERSGAGHDKAIEGFPLLADLERALTEREQKSAKKDLRKLAARADAVMAHLEQRLVNETHPRAVPVHRESINTRFEKLRYSMLYQTQAWEDRAALKDILGEANKDLMPLMMALEPANDAATPWMDDEILKLAVDDASENNMETFAETLAAYSPRACALFFGMLGPHMRANFQETDWMDVKIMPILLSGFLPRLQELLNDIERGQADENVRDEARHYAGDLINGLMFVPADVATYIKTFRILMNKTDVLLGPGCRAHDVLVQALSLFEEDFPADAPPEALFEFNATTGIQDLYAIAVRNAGRIRPAREIPWDIFAVHPKALSYYRWATRSEEGKRESLEAIYRFLQSVRPQPPVRRAHPARYRDEMLAGRAA